MTKKEFDVIIIGAGQAGLALGYYLTKKSLTYLLIDSKKKIGEVWRSRYDSLVLFTPRAYSSLPGLLLEGDPNDFPTKDEVADYLEAYAKKFSIPIKLETTVTTLDKKNDTFKLITSDGPYYAKKVVVATGPFQKPYFPSGVEDISKDIVQLHSSQYKNPTQLNDGTVLVIGGGNSGTQIAYECGITREVTLSISKPLKFLPQQLWGQSIFWWLEKTGLSRATSNSFLGKLLKKNEPVIGTELRSQIITGKIKLKPRAISFSKNDVTFEDNSTVSVNNIIWATGFKPDYNWIVAQKVTNSSGIPIHTRGISVVPNLFFLGLPWQYRRGSALLGGVGQDAEFICKKL